MPAAAIGAVGSILGGRSASRAAGRAADQQSQASQAAVDEQRRQFDITQNNFQPSLQAGNAALNQQRILLGLGGQSGNGQAQFTPEAVPEQLFSQRQSTQNNLAQGGAFFNAPSAFNSQQGERFVTNQSEIDAANQRNAIGLSNNQQQAGGLSAQQQQQQAFDNFTESPGQRFLRRQGEKALLRNQSAIGGLGGGNVQKALVEFGTGVAAQDFGNHFNRLAGLSGGGQVAGNSLAQVGANTATNIGNSLQQGGQARASGILGQSQAFNQTLGGLSNAAGSFFGSR
jgi:hypothetical protein